MSERELRLLCNEIDFFKTKLVLLEKNIELSGGDYETDELVYLQSLVRFYKKTIDKLERDKESKDEN